ncbi:VOC family protein [Candidatus Bipolaricaulota bacterium]|nr:VOC family protein [Candidatus Bipolaricaulota bacterium]
MAVGDICHIEMMTNDLAASKKFYEELFQWTFQLIPGMEGYALFSTPSGLGGGVNASSMAEPPGDKGPIIHLEVADITATLQKIEASGGKTVVQKSKISDEFGYYAIFLDCVGNRMGLWSQA